MRFKTEGVCFFGTYIGGIGRQHDPQPHLCTVVFEWDILKQLCEQVLSQASCQNSSQILLVALETVSQILKIAENNAIDRVFMHFEQAGCLDAVEEQTLHPNDEVAERARKIVNWYTNLGPLGDEA